MNTGGSAKTPTLNATEICRGLELSKDAQKLLQPDLLPRPYLDRLIDHALKPDAIRFMAHAMPRPHAIWWACLCARHAYGASPPAKAESVLQAAESWVKNPSDAQRRSALKSAEAAELNNPAGLIGMAVFFSGGSLAPAGVNEVPPEPHLCPDAVANSILLAAVMTTPTQADARYARFFELGFEVANGKSRPPSR